MRRIDGTFPPPHVLKALRAHASGRPCTRRLLTRKEAGSLQLSELVERGTADDIMHVVRTRFWFGLRDDGNGGYRHRQISRTAMLQRCRLTAAAERKRAHKSVRDIVERLRRDEAEHRQRVEEAGRRMREWEAWDAKVEVRRQRIAEARRRRLLREQEDREQEDRVQEIEKRIRDRIKELAAEDNPE